ncbi:DUF2939 domain-containing protein [Paucibacter sp. B51]|uniref:DUF2939 domain-containing protein n=1 Tax=Paucibacter sp. B51 TaxID=2993315 RepID=UPI0022EBA667|nr:DUF2939 domain-containing protein [Paucibacter sp. B51]
MSLKRFKLKHWLLAALALAGLALYASPYLALMQIREAARERDGAGLAAWVDFPSLRASVKQGVHERLLSSASDRTQPPSPARAMGAAVAGALLGPMVEALITPASLARLLQGVPPAAAGLPASAPAPEVAARRLETRMAYEHPNRFVFSIRPLGEDEEPVELVLHRRGLFAWRVVELRLP